MRIFETSRRHPGRTGDVTAIVLLERGLGGAATVLLGAIGFAARDRPLRRQRLPLARGRVRLRHARPDLPLLRPLRAAAARAARPLLAPAARRAAAARVLRRRPPLPRPPAAAARGVRVHDRDPGGADPLDLGVGQGGRDRPRPADLLRDGPALLPRPARPVHAERVRRARGVLRQLPRQRRRRRRPGLRRRLPLLPRDHGARACPGARSCSGRGCAAGRGRARVEHG